MASLPLALSIHHFISSVGADVGFASIIGLAILVLLFFAQGRETKLLRERTEQLAEHAQHLESQLGFLARQRQTAEAARERTAAPPVAARPAFGQAPAGAVSASRGPAVGTFAAVPAAPAGVGAPALASATKLIPTVVPSDANGDDQALEEDQTMLPQPAFAGAASAAGQPAPQTAARAPALGSGGTLAPPPPATAAAGANGTSERSWPDEPAAVPFPAPAAAGGGSTTRSARPIQPPSRGGGRASAASGRRPPTAVATHRRSAGGRRFTWLMAALAVIVIVAVLLVVTSGGSNHTPTTASQPSKHATRSRSTLKAIIVRPNTVTVAVLNGTVTNGLAHQVSVRLTNVGYRQGTVATDSNQTLTSTTVYYEPGHRAAALVVAKSLSLSSASVQPIDSSTQAVACPPPSPCTATVVVTVGTDLANG